MFIENAVRQKRVELSSVTASLTCDMHVFQLGSGAIRVQVVMKLGQAVPKLSSRQHWRQTHGHTVMSRDETSGPETTT